MKNGADRRMAKVSFAISLVLMAVVAIGMLMGPASAQRDPYSQGELPDEVIPSRQVRFPSRPDEVLPKRIRNVPAPNVPAPQVIPQQQVLPLTGADVSLIAATGFALIGTGSLLYRRSRKH